MGAKKNKNTADDCNVCEDKKLKCKTLVIQENGAKYRTQFTKKYENRKKWEKPNEKQIISYIPGTILKIFVKAGDKLKENDKIMAYEAMKMENIIKAEKAGIIKEIFVKEGESIPKGAVMFEMK